MRILFILDPNRFDSYGYLKSERLSDNYLLWFENPLKKDFQKEEYPIPFKRQFFWCEFITPKTVLNKIKPDKIVFIEIIDQKQIALIAEAKKRKIETIYLEHGAAGDFKKEMIRWSKHTPKKQMIFFLKKIWDNPIGLIKNKFFYFYSLKNVKSLRSFSQYIRLPFGSFFYGPEENLNKKIFPERVPDIIIPFSRANAKQIFLTTGEEWERVRLTGVPFFDSFYKGRNKMKNTIVFIDHPYLEENLLDWNEGFHEKIARVFQKISLEHKYKIYIKLHPKSDLNRWKSYQIESSNLELIQQGDYTDLYLSSKLIIGYSSSLLTAFICAKKNIVNIGWHPTPGIFGLRFANYGLCHESVHMNEVHDKLEWWINNNFSLKNESKYEKFIYENNDPFDGKAAERVMDLLLA